MTRHSINPSASPKHEDQRVVDLFTEPKGSVSFEQRLKTYREMARYILQEKVYVVPTFGEIGIIPYRSYVKGLYVPDAVPWNNSDRATIWLDK